MNFFRRLGKIVPVCSILALLSLQMAPLQAAMIDNDQLFGQAVNGVTKQQVLNTLERQDVQDKLVAMGVNLDDAKQRIGQMNDQELAQIAEQFDEMPAGSGIVSALLLVFVVLVVTDMLGATDVFTFVHDINH